MADEAPERGARRSFLGRSLAGIGVALSGLASRAGSAGGADSQPGPARSGEAAPAESAPVYYGPADREGPRVALRWAFSATVFFADRIMIQSPVPRGYTSVGGGEIWGPRLQGRILPHSGADYFKGSFSTYYLFQAADGALIFIHNRGTMRRFRGPPSPDHPLVAAAPGESEGVWTRFRATPVFTAPEGPHAWMSRTVFVACAQRQARPDHTVFTYYEVL